MTSLALDKLLLLFSSPEPHHSGLFTLSVRSISSSICLKQLLLLWPIQILLTHALSTEKEGRGRERRRESEKEKYRDSAIPV